MTKTILVTASIIFAVFSTQAQTDSEHQKSQKVTFGSRTGYEFQANNSNLEYRLNIPYVGAFTDIRLSEKWSFQLELNLRSEKRERLLNDGFRATIDEIYLTVPLLLKYHVNRTFKIYSGTQVLSASLINDISGLKKWNGMLGIEYDVTRNVFFDTRFRHGFEDRRFPNNFRDNRISLGIGYKF